MSGEVSISPLRLIFLYAVKKRYYLPVKTGVHLGNLIHAVCHIG